jgi:hypothetical protein
VLIPVGTLTISASAPPATNSQEEPTSAIVASPPEFSRQSIVTFKVLGQDTLSAVSLLVRSASSWSPVSWTALEDNVTITGLMDGAHTFSVRAVDAAGNEQQPPYANVSCVVDTVPPVTVVHVARSVPTTEAAAAALPSTLITNNDTLVLCASVVDATPALPTTTISPNGTVVPLSSMQVGGLWCGQAVVTTEGNYSVTTWAVDSAGNRPSTPSVAWVMYDSTPPAHSQRWLSTAGCVTSSTVTSCNASVSAVFSALCEVDTGPAASTCWVQWALESHASFANCDATGTASALVWSDVVSGHVDVTQAVRVRLQSLPRSRFVLHLRAVDAAGNTGVEGRTEWWVDNSPPAPPTLTSHPDSIGVSTTAVFTMMVPDGDLSPGELTILYDVRVGNTSYHVAGGNPTVPRPTPVNTAPTTLAIPSLDSGREYTIELWTRSLAGVTSTRSTTFTWTVLSSAPQVSVVAHPSSHSALRSPTFTFAADWGLGSSEGADANTTFEVLLLGDADLGTHHQPRLCEPDVALGPRLRDCVHPGCSAQGCNYTVYLLAPLAYTLQVSARAMGVGCCCPHQRSSVSFS